MSPLKMNLYLPTDWPALVWVQSELDEVDGDMVEVWRARIQVGPDVDILDKDHESREAALDTLSEVLAVLGAPSDLQALREAA